MNVCVKYWIDKEYTGSVYFKNIDRIVKNDKGRYLSLENTLGKKFIFRDSIIDSVYIGVNPDFKD